MRRLVLALLTALTATALGPRAPAHAADIADNPECQRLWDQLATPVAMRMLQYVQAADAYPVLPNGRPPVGLYPWAPAVYGAPGFPPPGAGFSWRLAYGYLPYGFQNVRLTTAFGYPGPLNLPPGGTPLSPAFVANQIVGAAGGIAGVAPGDLISLAGLHQAELGNLFAAAGTREAVIGNGLTAAQFNLAYAAYPIQQAVGYREVLEGLDFYVRNICPRAIPEDANGAR